MCNVYRYTYHLSSDSNGSIPDLASQDDKVVDRGDEVYSEVIDLHECVGDHH